MGAPTAIERHERIMGALFGGTPSERTFMGSHEAHIRDWYEDRRLSRKIQDCRRAYERREGRALV